MPATWETYKGELRDHPMMQPVIDASDDEEFTLALLDFIDKYDRAPGVTGMDAINSLRMVAGTLADMGWTLRGNKAGAGTHLDAPGIPGS